MTADRRAFDRLFEESILHQVPIYARLAELWFENGRAVPGWRDPEWSRLVAPPPSSSPAAVTQTYGTPAVPAVPAAPVVTTLQALPAGEDR
jgi:hypothetical protein